MSCQRVRWGLPARHGEQSQIVTADHRMLAEIPAADYVVSAVRQAWVRPHFGELVARRGHLVILG